MRPAKALLMTMLSAAILTATPTLRADEPLPVDPALVTGTIDNGLSYIIRKHANPEGRVGIWLHISTGSLNETEKTRGIAHYLEHMAFNGSKNFPPGSVVPYFQSLGLAFGRDQNAFTSFDQTSYQLYLPDTKPETIDKALMFLSDVATRLELLPKEIDEERGVILEEKRTRAGAAQRIQDYIFEQLAPESTFGRRLPIGTEETVKSVMQDDFKGYYGHFYVPSNMTVIVVGDLPDTASVIEQIKKQFGDGKKVERPKDLDVGIKPTAATRAIVASDAELKEASISMTRIDLPRGTPKTVDAYRKELIDRIGTWAFNRRISNQLAEGKASFLGASARVSELASVLRESSLEASGQPDKWKAMLTDLGLDLQRARLYGFTDRELSDARTAMISQAEESAQREATMPARAMLGRINTAVANGAPILSAQQRLDLEKKILPTITAKEVSDAFAANFDPTNVLFIAELPASADVPSESDLVKLGRAAMDVKPEKEAEVARADSLLKDAPKAGKIAESSKHESSATTTEWMDNGALVHHRFVDQRKHVATISITLAGGTIQETAANRGITEAAALAWERPASGSISSTQIRDFMNGKKVNVRGGAGLDTMTLTVSGDPAELETGLQLAYLLLTDPLIEPAAFKQWQDSQKQEIEDRKVQARGAISEIVAKGLYPAGEVRTRPLELDEVQKVKLDAAQAWLKNAIATYPIEVSIVGDVDLAKVQPLIDKYIGSLPKRARINDTLYADLRKIQRPKGPISVEKKLDVKTPQAIALDGFYGTDQRNIRDNRLLQMASRIMSTRMIKTIREEKQLVYSIGAQSQPADVFPGFGIFMAVAPTAPEKGGELAAAVEEMYTEFAKTGPTEEEMTTARKQFENLFSEQMKTPEFWGGRLAVLNYRGLNLDDTMAAPEAYQKFTAEEVREAFARYYKPDARFRFVVIPTGAGAQPAPAAEKKPG